MINTGFDNIMLRHKKSNKRLGEMDMKNKLMFLIGLVLIIGLFAGCSSKEKADNTDKTADSGNTKIDTLKVSFVPSRDPEEIVTMTEPLKGLLKDELAKQGYDVNTVDINVGTNYEAVGEALSAGTTDVGFIPGGTYVLYDDGADVILTATRAALNNDSDNPKAWNDNKPTKGLEDKQATYYRGLMIAGPSEKGQELAAKINSGEELTWEDLNSAKWAVQSTSSSSGYIYPTLWLQDKFGKVLQTLTTQCKQTVMGMHMLN